MVVAYTARQKAAYARKKAAARKNMAMVPANTLYGYGRYRKPAIRRNLRGYGDYYDSKGKRIPSSSSFAPDYGSRLGAQLGEGIQSLGRVFGFGAYTVKKNALLDFGGMDPPQVKNIRKGEATVIQHREYIGDIYSAALGGATSSPFNLQSFDIQPGLVGTFPWLSQVAPAFQEYEINGMVFEFKSLSADAVVGTNNSGALGSVIMATNYDTVSPNFFNKQEMLESEYSTDVKPSCSAIHPIECARNQSPVTHLYVRSGAVPAGADARLYDFANFQIATVGMQVGSALVGELWVSYTISFFKTIQGAGASGLGVLADKWQITGVQNVNPLGTTHIAVAGNTLGLTITSTTITFPTFLREGSYLLMLRWVGATATAITTPVVTIGAAAQGTIDQVWANSAGFDLVSTAIITGGTTTAVVMANYLITLGPSIVPPLVITFGIAGALPSTPNLDLVVCQAPNWLL